MNEEKLIDAMDELKASVNELTAIQQDIFKQDASHDDIVSLKGKMQSLIESNKELRDSIGFLNAAINELGNNFKKKF
jgi:hypothetical protein